MKTYMNIYGKVDSWGVFHICSSCTMCTHWIGFPGFVTIQRQAFIWWICVYTCTHLDSSLGCPGMSWDVLVQNDPQLTQESTDLLLAGRQERYGNAFGMKLDPSHQFAITIPNETTERVFDRSYGHLVVSHSLKTNMYNIYIYIVCPCGSLSQVPWRYNIINITQNIESTTQKPKNDGL